MQEKNAKAQKIKKVIVLPKFEPKKAEKEVISMRIDTEMLRKVDEKAAKYDLSRNELINQMIAFALNSME